MSSNATIDTNEHATIHELQWDLIRRLLPVGVNVVWEQGFWQAEERLESLQAAKATGSSVVLHYLDVSVEEVKRRIVIRNQSLPFRFPRVQAGNMDPPAERFDNAWGAEESMGHRRCAVRVPGSVVLVIHTVSQYAPLPGWKVAWHE